MLKATLKYNVGSKPKDLAPVEYSDRDRLLLEKRIAKLSGQNPAQELVEPEIFINLPVDLDDENDEFGCWNYRVVKYGEQYKIVEVFYNKHGDISGWADTSDTNLTRESFAELKGTYEYIRHAFEKPVLVVIEGDILIMLDEISEPEKSTENC